MGMGCKETTHPAVSPLLWPLSCCPLVCVLVTAAVKCPLQTWSNPSTTTAAATAQEIELNTQSFNGITEAGDWTSVCNFSEYKLAIGT